MKTALELQPELLSLIIIIITLETAARLQQANLKLTARLTEPTMKLEYFCLVR